MFGAKQVEVISKPIEIEIIQPSMPRSIDLKEPYWYVVSEAIITNPYKKNEEVKSLMKKVIFVSPTSDTFWSWSYHILL